MDNKIKQLRKGIFELVILKALAEEKHYGYSLIKRITKGQNVSINEGTIYPILSRLTREGLVYTEWVESSQGPPRKYYTLSQTGQNALKVLAEEFQNLILLFNQIDPALNNNPKKHKTLKVKKEKKDE